MEGQTGRFEKNHVVKSNPPERMTLQKELGGAWTTFGMEPERLVVVTLQAEHTVTAIQLWSELMLGIWEDTERGRVREWSGWHWAPEPKAVPQKKQKRT